MSIINVSFHLEKEPQHPDMAWLLRKTARIDGREFSIKEPVESVIVRLDVYEQNAIEIKRNDDTGEIMVLHHNGEGMPEVVLSVMEEQP